VTTYRLSNRQRKDLLIRATGLVIAIPQPYSLGDEDDPAEFARQSLPDDGGSIESAEWDDVAACPSPGGPGLGGLLGAIAFPPASVSGLHVVIRVALVRLAARGERRSHSTPQWPGVAIDDGRTYPKEASGQIES
jgi:hypothetical protein